LTDQAVFRRPTGSPGAGVETLYRKSGRFTTNSSAVDCAEILPVWNISYKCYFVNIFQGNLILKQYNN